MDLAQNLRLENTFQVFCKIIHLVVLISHFWKVLLLKIPQNVLHFIQTLLQRPRRFFSDYVENHPYSTNGLGGYCATVRHEVISWSTNATSSPFYCIFCIIKKNICNIPVVQYTSNTFPAFSNKALVMRTSNNTTSILGDHVPWIRLFQNLIVSKNYKC